MSLPPSHSSNVRELYCLEEATVKRVVGKISMIRTVAGLLDSLKQREVELIAQSGIRHAPTIGAQYEGLTSDLLQRMIPENLGLRVVSGFVEGRDGTLSGQIDCMLVYGVGTLIHQTTLFKCPIRQVIALFEVKKTLFSTQLEEAHHHLNSVLDMYIEFRAVPWARSKAES